MQWFFLIVKVNCSLSGFNMSKSSWTLRNMKNKKILQKKTSESVHPMICLPFASEDVMPGKQTTKQPVDCWVLRTDRATTHRYNDKHRNYLGS